MDLIIDQIKPELDKIIVQPFPIYFDCNDYHIIIFFKGHPEYESTEAMIKELDNGKTFIRAMLTRHDQTQVDYINDKKTVDNLKNRKRKREVHYTDIEYEYRKEGGKAKILLGFTSFKGEKIAVEFHAVAEATGKYAGLIDPGGHSGSISLPVMYPERTVMAAKNSKVTIDGVKYKIITKLWIPLLFKGMKGYYSEVFNIGVFRAGIEDLELIEAPSGLNIGEKWIYKSGGSKISYEIIDADKDNLIIRRDNETVTAQISNGSYKIRKVSILSPTKKNNSEFAVEFEPPLQLPSFENSIEKTESSFSISINDRKSLVTGIAKVTRDDGILGIHIVPVKPEWAAKRQVCTIVEASSGKLTINTNIIN